MSRTIVGVLRGGTSDEYALSLKSGAAVLQALPEESYHARDIFIDRRGEWHVSGIPMEPVRALRQLDVVVNALHGGIGEDGTVGRLLERTGVPYVGSRPESSARAFNRVLAYDLLEDAGLHVPRMIAFTAEGTKDVDAAARTVFGEFGPPYIVRPGASRFGLGVTLARTIIDLPQVLYDMLARYGTALVVEFIPGEEATTSVVEDFRGESRYAFPPAQVQRPAGALHLTFDHHRDGHVRHHCPSNFSHDEKQAIADAARRAHDTLGLSHVSRSHFLLRRGKPYLIEVESVPGLYEGAALPAMLEAVGSSLTDYLEHTTALARRG